MSSWAELAAARPEFAEAGERLLREHGVALLAVVGGDGGPRVTPVCPILAGGQLYLIAARHTPKARQLERAPRYALHAFLGPDDEEFQVRGRAEHVVSEGERSAAQAAAAFSFDPRDPVFRLAVEHALWCHWERVGRPDTRAVRRRWSAERPR